MSSKNLNLGIHNTSTRSTIPVFTPNFKISDTNYRIKILKEILQEKEIIKNQMKYLIYY